MVRSKRNTSKHHIIQRCDGGSDIRDNIVKLKKNRHQALHTLFGNITLPIEKIKFLLELHKPAFHEDCYQEIEAVLSFWQEQEVGAYNSDCFRDRSVFLK